MVRMFGRSKRPSSSSKIVSESDDVTQDRAWRCQIGACLCLAVLFLVVGASAYGLAPRVADSANAATPAEPITPIPQPPAADPLKLALGARLFGDTRLSGDGTRACSSCHDLQTNGADNRSFDTAPDGAKLAFNTPSIFNAALNFRFGWEGNYRTLPEVTEASLESPQIMGANVDEILKTLNADPTVRLQFENAYGHAPDRNSLLDAISTFENSLLTPTSRFDLWLEGDTTALSNEEMQGYQLFKASGCVSCHQGATVGGNLFERSGIFKPLMATSSSLMRVPSLRNVAATAPYFHDGSAATLDEAVRRMARAQLGEDMSQTQIRTIVAFLQTLTGAYQGKPVTMPSP